MQTMSKRNGLSTRQKVAVAGMSLFAGGTYIAFCISAVGNAWQRKEGDIPPASPWLQNAGMFAIEFPFGYVPGFDNILVVPLLNGLLWSFVMGAIGVRVLRRKSTLN